MNFSFIFLIVIICVAISAFVGDAQLATCTKIDNCSCMVNGKRINLQSVGYPDSRAPMFPYVLEPGSAAIWEYAYNPCYGFSDGSVECKNAIACQRSKDKHEDTFNIGDVNADWKSDSRGYFIEYFHTDSLFVTRTSQVVLKCDQSADIPKLDIQGQVVDEPLYYFTLTTKCACPGTCSTAPPPASGISPGSVLCILFSVLVVVYFVGGLLFMKFVRHTQGKEVIPNYELWVGVPGNIKDGFLFITSCGRKTGYESQT